MKNYQIILFSSISSITVNMKIEDTGQAGKYYFNIFHNRPGGGTPIVGRMRAGTGPKK